MRKTFALLAIALSGPAAAQVQASQPDVGTYVARSVTYTPAGHLGDGSNAKGGAAPAFTTHPEPSTDPDAANDRSGFYTSGTSYCLVTNTGNTCPEKKFRTHANSAKFLYDDPIRYYGQPGVSHCHEFFGNLGVNAYSTRQSLRARNASTAGGGPLNATGYWEPCWQKVMGGKLYAIPANSNTLYYAYTQVQNGGAIVDDLQGLHLLYRFIGATNMDDPDDNGPKAEIAAANAALVAAGQSARYAYNGNGFLGYVCRLTNSSTAATSFSSVVPSMQKNAGDTAHSRGFKSAGGLDPWNGGCSPGGGYDVAEIYAEAEAPGCWDGVNVSSPTGYKHNRFAIADMQSGRRDVCPDGWYRVPAFQLKTFHSTTGFADYGNWSLASDAMMQARLDAIAAAGGPASRTVLPGESFHFDWMNGWNPSVLSTWLSFCLGVGSNVPHECDTSTISATQAMIAGTQGTPSGYKPVRIPQVNLSKTVNTSDPTQLMLIDTVRQTMHNMR